MPPQQFTSPETHGVALYYLPPPGKPHNWLGEFVHTYTATTNQWASQTYNAWLQLHSQGSGLADLERQITDRMKAREETLRQAQRLAVQEQSDALQTLRVIHSTRAQMVIADRRNQTELAVARTQQQTEQVKAGALIDDQASTLLGNAKAMVSGFGQDLIRAAALPTPEAREDGLRQVERQMSIAMSGLGLQASRQLSPLELDEFSRELSQHAQLSMSRQGPEGLMPVDPDATRVVLESVHGAFRPVAERPDERFGSAGINPAGELQRSLGETRQALGIGPGAPLPAGGSRRIDVGVSGRIPTDPNAVSSIRPEDLDLSALRERIVADRRNRERTLEELLVRQLAPGILRRRDRKIEQAMAERGLPEVPGQRALNVSRAIGNSGVDLSDPPAPPDEGEAEIGRNVGEILQMLDSSGRAQDLQTGEVRPGTPAPGQEAAVATPAGGGGGSGGGGAPTPGPPAGANSTTPRSGGPTGDQSGLPGTQEAPFQISIEEARRLDGEVPSQAEIDQLVARASEAPDRVAPEIWDQLTRWQMIRMAVDDALLVESRGDEGFEDVNQPSAESQGVMGDQALDPPGEGVPAPIPRQLPIVQQFLQGQQQQGPDLPHLQRFFHSQRKAPPQGDPSLILPGPGESPQPDPAPESPQPAFVTQPQVSETPSAVDEQERLLRLIEEERRRNQGRPVDPDATRRRNQRQRQRQP